MNNFRFIFLALIILILGNSLIIADCSKDSITNCDSEDKKKIYEENPSLLSENPEQGNSFLENIFGISFSQNNGMIQSFKKGPPPILTTSTGASLSGTFSQGTISIINGIISINGIFGEEEESGIEIEDGNLIIKDEKITGTINKGKINDIPISGVEQIKIDKNGNIELAKIKNGYFGQFHGDFVFSFREGILNFAGNDNYIKEITTKTYEKEMKFFGALTIDLEDMDKMKESKITATGDTTISLTKKGKIDSKSIIQPQDSEVKINFDLDNHDKDINMVSFSSDSEKLLKASGDGKYRIKSFPILIKEGVGKDSPKEDIMQLQKVLRQLGLYTWTSQTYKDGIDGDYGPATEAAVKEFQKKYLQKEDATGIIDSETLELLHQHSLIEFQPGGDSNLAFARGSKGEQIKIAQRILKKLGHYTWTSQTYEDGIDGDYGPATEAAVKKFQSENGIESTGIIDDKTRTKMEEISGKSFIKKGTVELSRDNNDLLIQTEGTGLIFTLNDNQEAVMTFDGKKLNRAEIYGISIIAGDHLMTAVAPPEAKQRTERTTELGSRGLGSRGLGNGVLSSQEEIPLKPETERIDLEEEELPLKPDQTQRENSGTTQSSNLDITDRRRFSYDFFREKGLSPIHAAAILGNLQQESNFNPEIKGDKGRSYGLAQWQGIRRTELVKFAEKKGKPISDIEVQLEFILHEFETSEKTAGRKFYAATSIEEATLAFSKYYERPSKKYAHNDKRIKYAREHHLSLG